MVVPGSAFRLRQLTSEATWTLEIGAGPGQYRLAVRGTYVGADITAQEYKPGVPRLVDVVADANALRFRHDRFDVVFFSITFYHFPNAAAVLAQSRRVLAPGGTLLLFEYSRPSLKRLRGLYVRSGAHAEVRRCADWMRLLQDAGLQEVTLWVNSTSPCIAWRAWRCLGAYTVS